MTDVKLAIDPRWTGGGIGRFYREVLARLGAGSLVPRVLNIRSPLAGPLSPVELGRASRRSGCDLFWSPGFMPPLAGGIPFVITVHDLIHRDHAGSARKIYYDNFIRPLALRARAIVTVSEYSKGQILNWLGAAAPQIKVVGSGVSGAFGPSGDRLMLDRPYFLYVGNQRKHKNIARMLEAFAGSKAAAGTKVALSGTASPEALASVRRYSLEKSVVFLGDLDESELASAYRGALALIQVSLAEGFGLPVVEAMASGTPVICSSTTSLGEIAGNAAMLVDPTMTDQISCAMDRLWHDREEAQRLKLLGLQRSPDFSWENVATETRLFLESLTP